MTLFMPRIGCVRGKSTRVRWVWERRATQPPARPCASLLVCDTVLSLPLNIALPAAPCWRAPSAAGEHQDGLVRVVQMGRGGSVQSRLGNMPLFVTWSKTPVPLRCSSAPPAPQRQARRKPGLSCCRRLLEAPGRQGLQKSHLVQPPAGSKIRHLNQRCSTRRPWTKSVPGVMSSGFWVSPWVWKFGCPSPAVKFLGRGGSPLGWIALPCMLGRAHRVAGDPVPVHGAQTGPQTSPAPLGAKGLSTTALNQPI